MLMFFGCIIVLLILIFFISLHFPMFFARCIMRMMGINPDSLKGKTSNQTNTQSSRSTGTNYNGQSYNSGRAGNAHHESNGQGASNGEKIFRSDEGQYVDYEDVK